MPNTPIRLMLKPAQLRLLRAIADYGKLQLAAEACAMTQPAGSRMLAGIERQFDTQLFLRNPTGLEPTEIGRQVLHRADAILREMSGMSSDVMTLRRGQAGTVRVGAVTGPGVSHLVSAIRDIKADTPDAHIHVDIMPSRDLLNHLSAGDLDFALGRILPEFDSREFGIVPLRDERVAYLVRAGHPLASASRVTLPDLIGQEWIMQQRGAPIREAVMAAFADAGLSEPGNIVSSPSLLFTIAYLAQSDAISPVSAEVTDLLVRPPISASLTRLSVEPELRVARYYLLTLARRPLSALAQRLRDGLLRHVADDECDDPAGPPQP